MNIFTKTKRVFIYAALLALPILALLLPVNAEAFTGKACGGSCTDCHTLSNDEAAKLLNVDRFEATVDNVTMSEVKGLWKVEVLKDGQPIPLFVDFGKKFLIEGKFTPLEVLHQEKPKLDVSKIPVNDAVIMGDPNAKIKVIVFDDVDCPYCRKLHTEIKEIIKERPDIAFYIKLYPLPMHPNAYEKSLAIICADRSAKLLDDAMTGKELPKPTCKSDLIARNLAMGKQFGITGTPAIILPDGSLIPGYVKADVLVDLIDKSILEGNK